MGRSTPTTVLMEQFDTLSIQYRHIEHICMKESDSEKIIFDKMTSMKT